MTIFVTAVMMFFAAAVFSASIALAEPSAQASGGITLQNSTGHDLLVWGQNRNGQLGLGDVARRNIPTRVGATSDWASIFAGNFCSFAINSNGELFAWGSNDRGQLGLGDSIDRSVPTRVGTESNWVSVAADDGTVLQGHSLAINSNGELFAWGSNDRGQLGLGDSIDRSVPTRVGTESNWIAISVGGSSSFAINSNGELFAWGFGMGGRLGLGDNSDRNIPTRVGTASNWVDVAGGANHSIAINSDGELFSWGSGVHASVPTRVGTASNWIYIDNSTHISFAINSDGELFGWGQNRNGQLGLGDNIDRSVPTRVGTESNWIAISAWAHSSFAINSNGELFGWGQTGLGDNIDRNVPTRVGTSSDWVSVSAGNGFTLALGQDVPQPVIRTVTFNIFDLAEGAVWSAETPVAATFNLDVPVGTTISLAWLEANLPANLLTHLQRTGFTFESFVGELIIAEGEGNQVINMIFRAEQAEPPPVLCPDCNNPIDSCSCPPPPVLCPDCNIPIDNCSCPPPPVLCPNCNNPIDNCSCPPPPVLCADCNRCPCVCDTGTLETTPTPDNDRRSPAAGPKTGDMSNPTILLVQMIVAAMLSIAIVFRLSCPSEFLTKRKI